MAGEKLLSEFACKGAKARESIYYINDGAGLRLRIRPNRSKNWIFRYRLNTKERNPSVERKIKRTKLIEQANHTFGSITREWIDHNRAEWSEKHLTRNQGLLKLYLLPDLARLPIQEIEESYLFAILKPVYDAGKKISSAKQKHRCCHILDCQRYSSGQTTIPIRLMVDA